MTNCGGGGVDWTINTFFYFVTLFRYSIPSSRFQEDVKVLFGKPLTGGLQKKCIRQCTVYECVSHT